jgi:hypothetical protein
MEQRPKKLLEQVQDVIRLKHYSYQTEKIYIYWIRHYILFHNKCHPKDMGSKKIEEFLKIHLQSVKIIHQQDLQKGYGSVYLPFAKMRKYPRAKYD